MKYEHLAHQRRLLLRHVVVNGLVGYYGLTVCDYAASFSDLF